MIALCICKTRSDTRNTQEQGQDADDYGRISNQGDNAEIVDNMSTVKKRKRKNKYLKLDRQITIDKCEYHKWISDPNHCMQLCRAPNNLSKKNKAPSIEKAVSLPLLGGKGKTLTNLYL